jgi:hypothetical protein
MRFALLLPAFTSLFFLSPASSHNITDKPADPVPKELRDLAGTYTGEWTLFGIDDKGEVVKKAAWTDTVKVENPQVKDDRAFVTTTDEMTIEGRPGQPYKITGTEGYFLKKDGTLGDYFVEVGGPLRRMPKLSDNVWSYAVTAHAQELGQLGFPKDATAQHVLVKVVTKEGGIETHRISRVTTVGWKDKDGKERWLQFVSLKGFHKKQG